MKRLIYQMDLIIESVFRNILNILSKNMKLLRALPQLDLSKQYKQ